LGASVRFPAGGGLANLEAGFAQNIANLWQIPARERAAERSLDRAILELARDAALLATDAKSAYFEAVGADQRNAIAGENLTIAHTILELAQARQQAGAGTELDVNLSRNLVLDAELAVESTRLDAAEARRRLATLLGLTSNADDLRLVDSLPDIPKESPDAERLIAIARASRLDIQAAEQAVDAAEARLREQIRRVFPTVELGIASERGERKAQGGRDVLADTARTSVANGRLTAPDIQPRSERRTHTDFIIGPSLDLELPIFDQNQAQIAKAKYGYDQAIKALDALDRAVNQEVRGAVDRALTAWRLAQAYRDRSVPLAKSNLDLSQEAYRTGRTSFVSVLEAERFFLDARSRYVDAARAAAKAVPELERVIGLPFDRFMTAIEQPLAPETTQPPPQGQNP
jgi:cobalt-zinc-cadmium efflux system outer membrane protein